MMKKTLFCLLATTALSAYAQDTAEKTVGTFPEPKEVQTYEEQKIHMGVNLGMNNPSGGYDTSLGMGVDVGFQPYIPFGVGAEVFTTEMDEDNRNHDDQRTVLLARGTYNFGGEVPVIRHSYVGMAAGPVLTGETWDLGFAPLTGFDIPVAKMENGNDLTLGANIKYIYTTSATADAFMTSAAVKYWY
jgi:hypothetical protein